MHPNTVRKDVRTIIILTFSSITIAMKAKRKLDSNNINSTLLKYESENGKNGCIYVLKIKYTDYFASVDILKNNAIPFGISNPKK